MACGKRATWPLGKGQAWPALLLALRPPPPPVLWLRAPNTTLGLPSPQGTRRDSRSRCRAPLRASCSRTRLPAARPPSPRPALGSPPSRATARTRSARAGRFAEATRAGLRCRQTDPGPGIGRTPPLVYRRCEHQVPCSLTKLRPRTQPSGSHSGSRGPLRARWLDFFTPPPPAPRARERTCAWG